MTRKILTNAAAGALVVVLGLPAMAAPQRYDRDRDRNRTEYRSDRMTTMGRVTSVRPEGDHYRVTLDHGAYTYWVPRSTVRAADLRVGSTVRLGGIVNGDFVNVDVLGFPGDPYYTNDPNYRAVPYGSNGWMSGTVDRVNRHLGYLTIREDGTGNFVKIDVRHINMRRPINVWDIHSGDHISVNGGWENRDTFDANRVEY